ncbi:MFS transporter [Bifidobacterium pseudolongum]|uniref:MFS transporter n=1 Tax=Bifidobacterium pseudolongum TaxID=1694 RepID=UPI0013EDF8DC|nr:MFS transporter [Bifidobacterium pseudolongum]
MTPLSSYLNHRFTLKTSFIAAVVLCIAGLLLAALAVNFPMLMIARILQGAGTGVALPLMFNIILEQSPRSRLGLLMGVGNMVLRHRACARPDRFGGRDHSPDRPRTERRRHTRACDCAAGGFSGRTCVVRQREQTLHRPAHPHGCAPLGAVPLASAGVCDA